MEQDRHGNVEEVVSPISTYSSYSSSSYDDVDHISEAKAEDQQQQRESGQQPVQQQDLQPVRDEGPPNGGVPAGEPSEPEIDWGDL